MSKDIQVRKREDICASVRAQAASWLAQLLGSHYRAQGEMPGCTRAGIGRGLHYILSKLSTRAVLVHLHSPSGHLISE